MCENIRVPPLGIKVPHGFKTCVLSIFEWLLKLGFTVHIFEPVHLLYSLYYHKFNVLKENSANPEQLASADQDLHYSQDNTVDSVLSGHSERRQKLVFKTDYSLMQVKSIAECSMRAFCNTFDLH